MFLFNATEVAFAPLNAFALIPVPRYLIFLFLTEDAMESFFAFAPFFVRPTTDTAPWLAVVALFVTLYL